MLEFLLECPLLSLPGRRTRVSFLRPDIRTGPQKSLLGSSVLGLFFHDLTPPCPVRESS